MYQEDVINKKMRRMNDLQRDKLISMVEKHHKYLSDNRFKDSDKIWSLIGKECNLLGDDTQQKSDVRWRRAFFDMKSKLKDKLRKGNTSYSSKDYKLIKLCGFEDLYEQAMGGLSDNFEANLLGNHKNLKTEYEITEYDAYSEEMSGNQQYSNTIELSDENYPDELDDDDAYDDDDDDYDDDYTGDATSTVNDRIEMKEESGKRFLLSSSSSSVEKNNVKKHKSFNVNDNDINYNNGNSNCIYLSEFIEEPIDNNNESFRTTASTTRSNDNSKPAHHSTLNSIPSKSSIISSNKSVTANKVSQEKPLDVNQLCLQIHTQTSQTLNQIVTTIDTSLNRNNNVLERLLIGIENQTKAINRLHDFLANKE